MTEFVKQGRATLHHQNKVDQRMCKSINKPFCKIASCSNVFCEFCASCESVKRFCEFCELCAVCELRVKPPLQPC